MHRRKGRGWKNNSKTKSFFPLYLLVKSLIKGKKVIQDVLYPNHILLLFAVVDLVMRVNGQLKTFVQSFETKTINQKSCKRM